MEGIFNWRQTFIRTDGGSYKEEGVFISCGKAIPGG